MKKQHLSALLLVAILQANIKAKAQEVVSVPPTNAEQQQVQTNVPDLNDSTKIRQEEEVVVVGYGTLKKKDVTGAVASVGSKDFNTGVIAAPDQLIQGKVAGVQITNVSGQPGGGVSIKIRGNSSIRTGNNPLFVVDGIILDGTTARPDMNFPFNTESSSSFPDANPMNFINTNDIESIDVLKDASATAIYGSRGANGVVVITTKAAKSGQTKLEFGASLGVGNVSKKISVLDAEGIKAAQQRRGLTVINGGANEDAQDAIFRTALTQNYNVSATGGSDKAKFRFSGMYQDQEGIIKNSGIQKIVANMAASFKLLNNNKLKLDFNGTISQTHEQLAPISSNADATGDLIANALQWNPTVPFKVNGTINNKKIQVINGENKLLLGVGDFGGDGLVNPIELLEGVKDNARVTTILATIAPSYEIIEGLVARYQYSVNIGSGERKGSMAEWVNKATTRGAGWASIANNYLNVQQSTFTLNYTKEFGKISLNALVGYEYYVKNLSGSSMTGVNFSGVQDVDYTDILQYSTSATRKISSFYDPTQEIQSFFGRVNLNWEDKYLLTATLRADGSSKFGSNNKYGYFPSAGLAWNIHNEDFFKNLKSTLNTLKLRASWGITGNQEFPAGASVSRISYTSSGAAGQTQLANPNLQWQQDVQYTVAVEFGILKNRISGSVEYFDKTTNKLLYAANAADPGPGTTIWKNLDGDVNNRGVEILLNYNALIANNRKEWGLQFGLNYSYIANKVTGLPASIITGNLHGQGSTNAYAQLIANGQPLNVFYTRPYLGLVNGFSQYTNDGATFEYFGNPNPTSLLGFNTNLSYQGFTLTVGLNGAFGHKIFNNTDMSVVSVSNLVSGRNVKTYIGESDESVANRITPSSRYLEDGSFLRINNVTLSYTFDKITPFIKGLTLYVTGQNLYVFTSYSGYDPEVNTNKARDGVPSVSIDYIGYPAVRTFVFGLKASL